MKKEYKKQMEKRKKININWNWIVKITLLSFLISLVFSGLSEGIIANVNLPLSVVILLVFISIGILFDMIGVSVTSSDEPQFNKMCTKKIKAQKKP